MKKVRIVIIAVILVGITIIYLITLMIFNLSKNGINYEQEIIEQNIKKVLVAIFTGVNSLIILPYTAGLLEKLLENEINQKAIVKKLSIILVIFIICMFLECGYMKDIQKGILEMANVYSVQSNQK